MLLAAVFCGGLFLGLLLGFLIMFLLAMARDGGSSPGEDS